MSTPVYRIVALQPHNPDAQASRVCIYVVPGDCRRITQQLLRQYGIVSTTVVSGERAEVAL